MVRPARHASSAARRACRQRSATRSPRHPLPVGHPMDGETEADTVGADRGVLHEHAGQRDDAVRDSGRARRAAAARAPGGRRAHLAPPAPHTPANAQVSTTAGRRRQAPTVAPAVDIRARRWRRRNQRSGQGQDTPAERDGEGDGEKTHGRPACKRRGGAAAYCSCLVHGAQCFVRCRVPGAACLVRRAQCLSACGAR